LLTKSSLAVYFSRLAGQSMLDIADFIADRGGDPNKVKESQRRRYAPEEAVDEVIALYEDARRGESVYEPLFWSVLSFFLALFSPI
jgi:hypothetical protein